MNTEKMQCASLKSKKHGEKDKTSCVVYNKEKKRIDRNKAIRRRRRRVIEAM